MERKPHRLTEVMGRLEEWRRQRALSHERGFRPEPLDPSIVDKIPQDQEIVLFDNPSWFPREPHMPTDIGKEIHFPNPMTAGDQISHLQRKQMRRITRDGRR